MVYDEDPSDPPHQEFFSSERPQPGPKPPPTPEIYDLIVEVMKSLPGEPLSRVRDQAQVLQRFRQIQLEFEITTGMVVYVHHKIHPGG
jgi:hypothetical protein